MASIPTHMLVGASIGLWFAKSPRVGRTLFIGACCAAIPDLDAVGLWLGVPYESALGHRGFSHSLVFAGLLATLIAGTVGRHGLGGTSVKSAWAYAALATASHGLLDSLTNGGLGVGFLLPFDASRYFMPWQPIEVSPLGIRPFFTARGVAIVISELKWVWLPAGLLAAAARRHRQVSP